MEGVVVVGPTRTCAPVEEVVVSVDGFFGVAFIVLTVDFDLKSALGIDFLCGKLCTVLGCVAILRGITSQRTNGADFEGAAIRTALLSAAGEKTRDKRQYENYTEYLFHFPFLLSES